MGARGAVQPSEVGKVEGHGKGNLRQERVPAKDGQMGGRIPEKDPARPDEAVVEECPARRHGKAWRSPSEELQTVGPAPARSFSTLRLRGQGSCLAARNGG